MPTILLRLAYDGTAYAGWQSQKNGLALQDVLEEALEKVLGERVRTRAASRTDAGVHALDQAVTFSTTLPIPTDAYVPALNNVLPEDVAVRSAREVPEGFDLQEAAEAKVYEYRILLAEVRDPLLRSRVWRLRPPLDVEAMREAARAVVGAHDFSAFRGSGSEAKTSVREILSADWRQAHGELRFRIEGKGFLRYMVRILVGTMAEVGQGKRSIPDFRALLQNGDRMRAGPTAPPEGLTLIQVRLREGL
ncbi:MAG: tRNA pseudouridine(38-40) synthase TruA [Candidatus Methylomirabilis sp.]|nr:tRNA pseudouridine(38-40) synthase TruA [Deltaproteobacteria bacterium]